MITIACARPISGSQKLLFSLIIPPPQMIFVFIPFLSFCVSVFLTVLLDFESKQKSANKNKFIIWTQNPQMGAVSQRSPSWRSNSGGKVSPEFITLLIWEWNAVIIFVCWTPIAQRTLLQFGKIGYLLFLGSCWTAYSFWKMPSKQKPEMRRDV